MVTDGNKIGAGYIAAIGNFDGVHRGHEYLLAQTAQFAKQNGAHMGVVLFDPHPRRYFRPEDPAFLLTSPAQRDQLLRAHGVEKIFSLTFDKAFAALSPEEFVRDVLKDRLGLNGVVAGEDFRFGAGRAGDSAALKEFGGAVGLEVQTVSLLAENSDTAKYGSSAIRAALGDGDVTSAATMLGRPWSVRAFVIEGQKLGRTLGFPTANMLLGHIIEPRNGVYAVTAVIDGVAHHGVANFGRRPTVGADTPLLEVHLFDFEDDLYGKEIEVSFINFIRDEQKFDGLDALKAQIHKDTETARVLLA